MSSKSKQHRRKGASPAKGAAADGASPASAAERAEKGLLESDEIVHVPKNTSPLRFVLMIALIIILLIIFIVPGALMGTFGRGGPQDAVYVGWRGPDGSDKELGYTDFQIEKRLLVTAIEVDPLLAGFVGSDGRNVSDEQLARFLILDQLAVENGLHVSDTDLREHLLQLSQLYGGVANYRNVLGQRSRGMRAQDVEATVRRVLRAMRYLQVSALVAAVPDPATIEELWNDSHEELRLEWAALDASALEDDARAELPGDEALASWYEELPAARKKSFEIPEERAAEVVSFVDPATTPAAGLLAAYPEVTPEGEEPVSAEERARQYYDQVYFWHFLREPRTDEDGNPLPPEYVPFEEVADVAAAEAPVFFAMQRWLTAMREELASAQAPGADEAMAEDAEASPAGEGEEGGEEASEVPTIDLAARAAELGLAYEALPLGTRQSYRDREPHRNVGDTFATRVFQTNVGEFAYSVVARGGALSIVRVSAVQPASTPPFEEVRERVADLWVEDRAQELATERLEEVRAAFSAERLEGEPDHVETPGEEHDHRYAASDTFRNATTAVGARTGERAWFDSGARMVPNDPALDEATNAFLRNQRQLAGLADDEVSMPLYDPVEKRAYLVRLAERRAVPIERMSPSDLEAYKSRATVELQRKLLAEPSTEYLERTFGLYFVRASSEEEPVEEPSQG